MNDMTLGQRIAALRRQMDMTQETLAEALGVSPQAVSKWENDISCPDIMLLPQLAKMLGVTVDALLSGEPEPETRLVPVEKRKNADAMILKMTVDSSNGDKVRINLPLALVKAGIAMNVSNVQVNGQNVMEQIDFDQILRLVDSGVIGKLVEIDSDGDHVEIWVE